MHTHAIDDNDTLPMYVLAHTRIHHITNGKQMELIIIDVLSIDDLCCAFRI